MIRKRHVLVILALVAVSLLPAGRIAMADGKGTCKANPGPMGQGGATCACTTQGHPTPYTCDCGIFLCGGAAKEKHADCQDTGGCSNNGK
jgi:hypothetical protein